MLNLYTYKRALFRYRRALSISALLLIWIVGFSSGIAIASRSSAYLLKLTFSFERVSFVGLVFASILPLIISALAVKLSAPLFLLIVAFTKALLFGFAVFVLHNFYGNAFWLSRWLYMFSDSLMTVFLLWFWLRSITGKSSHFDKDLIICLISAAVLVLVDYFIVSPFALMLFNYY